MGRVSIVCVFLFSAVCAFAQGTQSETGDSIAGEFRPLTFRGCLAESGTQYALVVAGVTPRQYHLAGSNLAQLEGKAGHLVSITGTIPNTALVGATTVSTATDIINFLAVDDLGTTCKSSIQGATGETPHSTASMFVAPENQYLGPTTNSPPDPELHAQLSSYTVVPLVGVLALGLLKTARYYRRK